MALKVTFPTEKTFPLTQADPSGETFVTVKQASYGEHAARAELTAEVTRVYDTKDAGRVEEKRRFSYPEIIQEEVFLTLVDCNIEVEDADGKVTPLIRFGKDKGRGVLQMNRKAFAEAWKKLPLDVALEIHGKVLEVNPDWGPSTPEG